MNSKMVFVIIYVVYLIIGSVLNNMFVRDVVKKMFLNEIASRPESFYDLDIDASVSFAQFVIGIIFELFWPIFMVVWIIKIIQILISRKSK